jgi:tetratricopeptide (TPR) repeat protein
VPVALTNGVAARSNIETDMSADIINEAIRLYNEAGRLFRESQQRVRQAWQAHYQGQAAGLKGWADIAAQNSAAIQHNLERIIALGATNEQLRQHKVYALAHRNLGLYSARRFKPFHTVFPTYMEEAAKHLTTALRLGAEKDKLVTRRLGAAYFQAGKYKEAVEPLREAIALNEQDEVARYHLCLAYLALHDLEQARAQYEALQQNPANPHYHLVQMLEPMLARPMTQVDEAEREEMKDAIKNCRPACG